MLGGKIKKLRERANMNQTELAERMELKQRAVSWWETDKSKPSLDQLERLSEVFNVPITYWFSESDEFPERDNVTLLLERLVRNKTITDPDDIPEPVAKAIIDAVKMDLRLKQLGK